jgi:hypothetical protein
VATPGEFEHEQRQLYARHLVETKTPEIDRLVNAPSSFGALYEEVSRLPEGEVRDLLLLALIRQRNSRTTPAEFADWMDA